MNDKLKEMTMNGLASLDEEIQGAFWDVYYEPNNDSVWFVSAGDAYEGDDEDAYQVFQLQDREIITEC